MAEDTGFEPADPCGSTVFKTAAFDRSANPPRTPTLKREGKFLKFYFVILSIPPI